VDRPLAFLNARKGLPDTTFHLQLNQAVELDGVLHRDLLGDRLDEVVDNFLMTMYGLMGISLYSGMMESRITPKRSTQPRVSEPTGVTV
jgi:hypothetical protein